MDDRISRLTHNCHKSWCGGHHAGEGKENLKFAALTPSALPDISFSYSSLFSLSHSHSFSSFPLLFCSWALSMPAFFLLWFELPSCNLTNVVYTWIGQRSSNFCGKLFFLSNKFCLFKSLSLNCFVFVFNLSFFSINVYFTWDIVAVSVFEKFWNRLRFDKTLLLEYRLGRLNK